MFETALKLLKKLEKNGYEAYIVGGFVRDYLLNRSSQDVDICTSATPKDIRSLFEEENLSSENYGSVVLQYKGVRFEVTTFRKEDRYDDFRRPNDVTYITSLEEDLKRRDFTINSLLINSNGEVLDYLHGKEDLEKGLIRTIGDSYEKFSQDALRILRAIRFATILNFTLSDEVKEAIDKTKPLLKELSYERKKKELDCIFASPNVLYGVQLLQEFGLDTILEIPKLGSVPSFDDVLGVWAYLDCDTIYPFRKNERQLMESIRAVMTKNVTHPVVLYHYGLYVCGVASKLLGKSKKEVTRLYHDLAIHNREEIPITSSEICALLNREEGSFLKDIWKDLEKKILDRKVENNRSAIETYLKETYLTS